MDKKTTIQDVLGGDGSKGKKEIQIKAHDDILRGAYSNLMQITHTQDEFVLDYMMVLPPQGILTARVILTSNHFKRILGAMLDNLKKFEEKYGEIKLEEKQKLEGEEKGA